EESNFDANKISVTSPIGKALLGKTNGESLEIKVPAGLLHYKILDVTR
ncbi:MAG: GreA/GreB family elongation factor, partial [Bacteroidota bacterium]